MFTEQEFNRVLDFLNTPDPTTGRTVWDMALSAPNLTENEGGKIVQKSDANGVKISGGKGHKYISVSNNEYGLGKDMLPFTKGRKIRVLGQEVSVEEVKFNPYAWKIAMNGANGGIQLSKTESKGAESIYAQLTQQPFDQLSDADKTVIRFLHKQLGKDPAALPNQLREEAEVVAA